jgi:outer membrane protein TolC
MVQNFMPYVMCKQLLSSLLSAVCLLLCLSAHAVTLEEAIDSALKIDPTIRSNKLNQQATEENIAIARSRLLPQISLQGSTSQLTQTTTQDLPVGGNSSRSFTGPSVNHQLVMRQALVRPKEMSSLRYAKLQAQYTELKYMYDVAELKSRVINAWIDLIAAQQIAQAYERPLPFMQAAAKQELAKFEQGDSTKDTVMEANAQYENAKATHFQAVETLKSKKSSFERITKISSNVVSNKTLEYRPMALFTEIEKNDIWENMRDKSLELKMSNLQQLLQQERVKLAVADHKPTLDLLAAFNFAQNDATSTQGYQYKNKQIGVQYNLPIYAGGATSASIRQAQLTYEASIFDYSALLIKLENDFQNNWTVLLGLMAKQKALYESLLSIQEQIQATQRSINLGVKSNNENATVEMNLARRMVDFISITQDCLKLSFKINYGYKKINI